jgi:prepilin-type N-terminal cleavage/methylation domain-containing protein
MRAQRGNNLSGRGFTLVEAVITLTIVSVLVALIFVAIGAAVRTVRSSVERQVLRSVKVAVDQFKDQYGFLPPLIDSRPIVPDTTLAEGVEAPTPSEPGRLVLTSEQFRSSRTIEELPPAVLHEQYLRYEIEANEPRWSNRTLTAYLFGGLGERVNGSREAGSAPPRADGTFDLTGRRAGPLLDPGPFLRRVVGARFSTVTGELVAEDPGVLTDRWGNAVRFYRWLPTLHVDDARELVPDNVYPYPAAPVNTASANGAMPNDRRRAGEVRSYNVPPGVGDPLEEPELRGAGYAVVSAGPDGLFGDEDLAVLRERLGMIDASATERDVRARARQDNIREVGS